MPAFLGLIALLLLPGIWWLGSAAIHILGALALTVWLKRISWILGGKWGERAERDMLKNASIALRIPGIRVSSENVSPELFEYLSSRYDTEMLKNRISDFFDSALLIYSIVGDLILMAIGGILIYKMTTDGTEDAIMFWTIPLCAVLLATIEASTNAVCFTLTGRYPGEVKRWRMILANHIKSHVS